MKLASLKKDDILKMEYAKGETGEFIKVDQEACTGCGLCEQICPTGVWAQVGDIYKPVHLNLCSECGACWDVCAPGAVILGDPVGGTGVVFSGA